jgi:hypothetical protein
MKHHAWVLLFAYCALMGISWAARATTIIAKLEDHQIILAVDARADRVEVNSEPSRHAFHDDACKILPLGDAAAAVAGNMDYKRNVASDPIPDWDAVSDARAAYAAHDNNLHEIARDWAERAASHYRSFYEVAPQRVARLAAANLDRVIVMAFFVGWDKRTPILLWEKVYIDNDTVSGIRTSEQVLPSRALPYTSLATTQELIEGDTARKKNTEAKWETAFQNIPETDRDWRWIEFLVKSTSQYDEAVGQTVNVLQLREGHRAKWLQNLTCPEK